MMKREKRREKDRMKDLVHAHARQTFPVWGGRTLLLLARQGKSSLERETAMEEAKELSAVLF